MVMMTELVESAYLYSIRWAVSQGVIVEGIVPIELHGRGLGMVATRTIEVGPSARHCQFTMVDIS